MSSEFIDEDMMEEIANFLSPKENTNDNSYTGDSQKNILVNHIISTLQSFSPDDINKFFREVNAGLSKRFASVVVSRKFRDLPQGKLRTKIR